jgi:predicted dinucleotide-binding enzyme
VIAVPGPAVAGFVQEHAPALAGKLVIDCANIIRGHPTNSKDVIAAAAPDARYVRAFNTLGWENLRDPHFGGQTADMFFSAPMTDREMVETLIHDVGLRPVFLGEGAQDVVDMLLPVWFALATQRGSRHVAFRVLED